MPVDPKTVLIGEILVSASLISQADLNEALEISRGTKQMIGQVLTMSGFLTDQQLESALKAQEQMRKGELSWNVAMECLRVAIRRDIPFDQAARLLGYSMVK